MHFKVFDVQPHMLSNFKFYMFPCFVDMLSYCFWTCPKSFLALTYNYSCLLTIPTIFLEWYFCPMGIAKSISFPIFFPTPSLQLRNFNMTKQGPLHSLKKIWIWAIEEYNVIDTCVKINILILKHVHNLKSKKWFLMWSNKDCQIKVNAWILFFFQLIAIYFFAIITHFQENWIPNYKGPW
jgi:hypothetical protein